MLHRNFISKLNFKWFLPIQTRWKDNDQYGHINNAVYHSIFDSAINIYLIRFCGLKPNSNTEPIGFMVKNHCEFIKPASYPSLYMAGVGIDKIGKSSISYKVGLFKKILMNESMLVDPINGHFSDDVALKSFNIEHPICTGEYIHVFVDPITKKPTQISEDWKKNLKKIILP